ncbi:MAG: FumA C-terminus/TtdB family hydratase beta subunit [Firmicutes bacterium]|nr:FumA C-terminus/TtdB family hydratase beta subunit [Bacillota bacterium]
MDTIKIKSPVSNADIAKLRAGDKVLLSGVLYTARDAAHKRIADLMRDNKPLPLDLTGQTVYYAGPCPAPPDKAIGSCGPTTSSRMDVYAGGLIQKGIFRVMIGKGDRNGAVIDAIQQHNGLYLAAIGGAGALISLCVKKAEIAAFADLGAEAIYKLTVQDMPLIVAADCKGGNLYELQ